MLKYLGRALIVLCGLASFLASGHLRAQSAQNLPVQVPSSAEPRLPGRAIPVPEIDLELTIPAQPRSPDRRAVDELNFNVDRIVIEGGTAYSQVQLDEYTKHLIAQTVGLSEVSKAAEAIEDRYRADGYVLSRAFVPPQRVGDGAFRIQIVEGYLDEIVFDGGSDAVRERIRSYMSRAFAGRPANLRALERGLLLAGDLAGVNASGTLTPGQAPGSSNLAVKIEEKALGFGLSTSNRASKFQGPVTTTAEATFNGLLGLTEQFTASYTVVPMRGEAQELRQGAMRYTQPVGNDGLTLGWDFTMSQGELGHRLKALKLFSESKRFGPRLSYPVIRSRRENLVFDASTYISRSFSYLTSISPFEIQSNEQYSAFELRSTYTHIGFLQGATVFSGGYTHGFAALNSTRNGEGAISRANADAAFDKFSGEIRRIQVLPESFSLQWVLAGQMTPSRLYANEEFSLGGTRFGRGYDPSEVTGQRGLGTSFDLRYGDVGADGWQPYIFYDHGRVWSPTTIRGTASQWQSLTSAGAGFRYSLTEWLNGSFELAQPLTRAPALADNKKPLRLYFDISARF